MSRLLVVEDNDLNQKLMERFLGSLGYEVLVATDSGEADRAVAAGAVDLVLLDVSLPGEDGLSWIRRHRSHGAAWPTVAVTAHALHGHREAALAAGCDDYLAKPIGLQELEDLVALILRGDHPRVRARRS